MSDKRQTEKAEDAPEDIERVEEEISELRQAVWAVIGFEGVIASGLTYAQAVEEAAKASEKKVSGLCIITDEAAARIKRSGSVL